MTAHDETTGHDAASSDGAVTVTEDRSGGYTQQIVAGRHRLVADEPRPIGEHQRERPTIFYWPG
jgi:putative redox protein